MDKLFKLAAVILVTALLILGLGAIAGGAKPSSVPVATLTLEPGSNLVYGGSASISIAVTNYGSDTANLYTYCNQSTPPLSYSTPGTFLTGSNGVIGSGIKGVRSPAIVTFPYNGTPLTWTGGSAYCQAELVAYQWKGNNEIGASILATLDFTVSA